MNTAAMLSSGDLWTIATLFCGGFPSLLLSLRDTDYQLSANKTRLNTEFCFQHFFTLESVGIDSLL